MGDDNFIYGPIWGPQWLDEPLPYEPPFTFTDYENVRKRIESTDIRSLDLDITESYNLYTDKYGGVVTTFYSKEDIPEMKVEESRVDMTDNYRYAVACHNYSDLSPERILKSLSIMKSKLMMECMPIRIEKIECKMSPMVKTNIINAYRKVSMYGKKTPFVACFDDYGRRLPDEIQIDTIKGMDLKIVDPLVYGDNYLVFEAVIPRRKKEDAFTVKRDPSIFYE